MLADDYRVRTMDGVHDMLLRLGDLNRAEILQRCASAEVAISLDRLGKARRALELRIGGEKRWIAVEDAARYRDALGIPLPPGLPTAFLELAADAITDLIRRYGRTHGPFTTTKVAARFELPLETVEAVLQKLVGMGRIVEGAFCPGGQQREWCDVEVLRTIRRRSLAKLRKEVEPVEQQTLARLFTHWQGVLTPRRGLDALLDAIENLQGAPLPASLLETEILPSRIANYKPADLDTLIAAGEVTWAGFEPIGERDGRVGLYLAEKLPLLWPVTNTQQAVSVIESGSNTRDREERIIEYLRTHGASFFQNVHDGTDGGFPNETIEALWDLVWRGAITNDSLQALRAYTNREASSTRKPARRVHNQQAAFRSRRTTPPTAQGRWVLHPAFGVSRNATEWSHAEAQQLLQRYGVVFRETAHAENLPGGFSAVYDVLKALEESGKVRRGYFAAELGATQFALPSALDLLRSLRNKRPESDPGMVVLAATDPANPYGALLRWPVVGEGVSLQRSVGARVVLADGALVAYLRRGNPNIQVFLPEEEPQRGQVMRALARYFVVMAQMHEAERTGAGMFVQTINGINVAEHPMARALLDAGFQAAPLGFNLRRNLPPFGSPERNVGNA
jgi:ATP-dependent Lhr-like helicase